jgi:hypothetical protein
MMLGSLFKYVTFNVVFCITVCKENAGNIFILSQTRVTSDVESLLLKWKTLHANWFFARITAVQFIV